MGQKVNPNVIRLGIVKLWNSVWFTNSKNFSNYLKNDFEVRKFLYKKLVNASVSKIIIERPTKSIKIIIYTSRPGVIIGKKGEDIEKLRKIIAKITGVPSQINIFEIRKPEIDAILVAKNVSLQLEKRIMFRRVMKRSISNAIRFGAKGIKIKVKGRLGGAEIARTEWYKEGRVPLHTLRADIDYGTSNAYTNYGVIGVKVWIFKGEILDNLYSDKFIDKNIILDKKHFLRKKFQKKYYLRNKNVTAKTNKVSKSSKRT